MPSPVQTPSASSPRPGSDAQQEFWGPYLAQLQPLQPPYRREAGLSAAGAETARPEAVGPERSWMGLEWSLERKAIATLALLSPQEVSGGSGAAPFSPALLSPALSLCGALTAFLYRLNREESAEISLQTPQTSLLPYRIQMSPEQTCAQWLDHFFETYQAQRQRPFEAAAIAAQTLPIQFQIVESLLQIPPPESASRSPLPAASVPLQFWISADGQHCRILYCLESFEQGAIARMHSQFSVFLAGIVAQPEKPLSQQPLLSPSEQRQLLVNWNPTAAECAEYAEYSDDDCVHHGFERQVERSPEALALTYQNQSLTYRVLNQRANQLAHHLRSLGVEPDSIVGLCLERSLDLIVGVLGILKAGGAYLPLDPTYPAERLALMIEDAQPDVILTQTATLARLPSPTNQIISTNQNANDPGRCLCLDGDGGVIAAQPRHNPAPLAQPHHLAYIIYTSGSTGRPKGVMIEHRSLSNFAQASLVDYGIDGSDRVLQFASISFDAAAEEIYPCLMSGGELVLRSPEMMSSVPQFLRQCQDYGLTVLDLPTAYWHLMVAELKADPALTLPESIKIVIIGGEAVNPQRVAQWQQILWRTGCRAQLINTYGPTETTVVATAYKLPWPAAAPEPQAVPRVTIGRSLPKVKTYVLDDQQQPVPLGLPGELCIGGAGVARGYLGREDLTAARFLPDPFASAPAARLYRTGDLVRVLPNGEIDFLGRIDNQVKIRGFRIELGEIEALLTQQNLVQNAVVIVRQDKPGQKQLVAYVVLSTSSGGSAPDPAPDTAPGTALGTAPGTAPGTALDTAPLRQALAEQLPEYMVPAAFVVLEALPMTPNSKVDRRALPIPAPEDFQTAARTFVAPATPTEARLAQLWQGLLGQTAIGATDNFFELGGTSLLAVKLFLQIEKRFGRSLQLSALLQAPTVRSLAQVVDDTATPPAQTNCTTVVPLQPTRPPANSTSFPAKPPIFFVNSISYAQRFVPYLGQDQPFYCLNLFGATSRLAQSLDHLTLEQMAEEFVADLLRVQPQGPYHIGSYCGDTKLAIAMGHHLQALGHEVGLQVLIDPMWDEPSGIGFHWQNLQRFGPGYALEKLKNRLRLAQEQAVYRSRQTLGQLWDDQGRQQLQADLELYGRYLELCDRHQPAPYRGAVTVIACQELSEAPTPRLEQTFQSGFSLRQVPGYHHTLFQKPQLQRLVEQFQAAIQAAQTAQAATPAAMPEAVLAQAEQNCPDSPPPRQKKDEVGLKAPPN